MTENKDRIIVKCQLECKYLDEEDKKQKLWALPISLLLNAATVFLVVIVALHCAGV